MRFLIQKIKSLKIYKEEKLILKLNNELCYLVYVGIERGDENKNLQEIVKNFEDLQIIEEGGRFLKKIKEIKPKLVFVSNITLLANFSKGRINFNSSINSQLAKEIFENLIGLFKNYGYNVFSTDFGSYLEIESLNQGPINFYLTF